MTDLNMTRSRILALSAIAVLFLVVLAWQVWPEAITRGVIELGLERGSVADADADADADGGGRASGGAPLPPESSAGVDQARGTRNALGDWDLHVVDALSSAPISSEDVRVTPAPGQEDVRVGARGYISRSLVLGAADSNVALYPDSTLRVILAESLRGRGRVGVRLLPVEAYPAGVFATPAEAYRLAGAYSDAMDGGPSSIVGPGAGDRLVRIRLDGIFAGMGRRQIEEHLARWWGATREVEVVDVAELRVPCADAFWVIVDPASSAILPERSRLQATGSGAAFDASAGWLPLLLDISRGQEHRLELDAVESSRLCWRFDVAGDERVMYSLRRLELTPVGQVGLTQVARSGRSGVGGRVELVGVSKGEYSVDGWRVVREGVYEFFDCAPFEFAGGERELGVLRNSPGELDVQLRVEGSASTNPLVVPVVFRVGLASGGMGLPSEFSIASDGGIVLRGLGGRVVHGRANVERLATESVSYGDDIEFEVSVPLAGEVTKNVVVFTSERQRATICVLGCGQRPGLKIELIARDAGASAVAYVQGRRDAGTCCMELAWRSAVESVELRAQVLGVGRRILFEAPKRVFDSPGSSHSVAFQGFCDAGSCTLRLKGGAPRGSVALVEALVAGRWVAIRRLPRLGHASGHVEVDWLPMETPLRVRAASLSDANSNVGVSSVFEIRADGEAFALELLH